MEVPVAKLEQEQLEYLSQLFEVPTFYLQFANFPVYTVLECRNSQTKLIGEAGKEYKLYVRHGDIEAEATTTLMPAIQQDNPYFFFPENSSLIL